MRKCIGFLLSLLILVSMLSVPALATSATPEFFYELTVDGKEVKEANPGDIITVTLHLYRTDDDASYTMYAMQDEIRYDSEFFKLVENSQMLTDGIQSVDIDLIGEFREFYMNFVSLGGGTQWPSKMRVGSFQLEVVATSGVSTITNQDYLVSFSNGNGSYPAEANELTVIVSTDCTVRFETNGGTPIDPITAIYGELLTRPKDPIREGKHIVGWFKDIHLTEEWNFETDEVKGNMTLYAKWADGNPVDCFVCGRNHLLVFGLGLCWLCLLILLVLLALLMGVYLLYRKNKFNNRKETKNVQCDVHCNEDDKQKGESNAE